MKIYEIVKKDIKILIRSKLSALIILLGPLLIVSLIGMAFNSSSVNSIKITAYSKSYSNLSENLIAVLKDQQFSVVKINTENECVESIKSGKSHVCMVLPEDLDVAKNSSSDIIFHVDNSRINLVYFVISEVSKKISLESVEISKGLAQNIINVLQNAEIKLLDDKEKITSLRTSNTEIGKEADSIRSNADSIQIDVNSSQYKIDLFKNGSLSCSNCSQEYSNLVNSMISKIQNLESESSKINTAKESIKKGVENIRTENTKGTDSLDALSNDIGKILSEISSIQVKESEKIANPIKTSIKPISQSSSNLNFLLPTLIALVIMLVSILLSSTIVIREKKTRAYFRNFITPTNNFTFLIGTFITCLLILIIQLVIIFSQIINIPQSQLAMSLNPTFIFVLFITAMLFILFGMLIGYAFQSEETVTLASMSVATIFLFISNTILPIETIPNELKWLAFFNPFVIADSILKKILLFNQGIGNFLTEMYLLIAYVMLFWSLVYLAREVNKRKIS